MLTLEDNQGKHIKMSNCNLRVFFHYNLHLLFFNWFDPSPVHTFYVSILFIAFWRLSISIILKENVLINS